MANLEKSPFKVQVGHRLRQVREALGHSQADMCRLLDVPSNKYSQWESGLSGLQVWDAIRVCNVTGASLDYLYRDIAGSMGKDLYEKMTFSHPPKPQRPPTRIRDRKRVS